MEDRMVSVIVPTYNLGKYIKNSIQSILNQTYEDFELIIIDDMSTDDTYEVCGRFKDPRITLLRNDRNKGVSYTRNRAISIANGEYITFVDGDDIITNDYLELLVKETDNNPHSLVTGGLMKSDNFDFCSENMNRKAVCDNKNVQFTNYKVSTYLCNQFAIHPSSCDVLFRSDIIKSKNILFDEKAIFAEDTYFIAKYCCFVSDIIILKDAIYYYFQRPDGGGRNKLDRKYKLEDILHRATGINAYEEALAFAKSNNSDCYPYMKCGICFLAADILLMAERAKYRDANVINKMKQLLQENIKGYLKESVDKKEKMLIIGMNKSPAITKKLLDIIPY